MAWLNSTLVPSAPLWLIGSVVVRCRPAEDGRRQAAARKAGLKTRRESSHNSGDALLSLNDDGNHATSLPADGRDVMADLVPVGIEGEVAEEG
jgi:hypothetical protein